MPVKAEDLKTIEEYVDELGLEGDARANMIKIISENDKAATQFIGQRARHMDYTKKTQTLAQEREELKRKEAGLAETVKTYAADVQAANEQAEKVIKDLEKERINTATANARIQAIADKYQLGPDDLPTVDPTGDVKPAAAAAFDEESLYKKFEERMAARLLPHLNSSLRMPGIVADITDEHKALIGKRLTSKEISELMEASTKDKVTLVEAWENKYEIKKIRDDKWREGERAKMRQEIDDADKAKRSQEAIDGVRGRSSQPNPDMDSPVVNRQYQTRDGQTTADGKGKPVPVLVPESQQSGASKAAETYMRRRAEGIPLGTPPTKEKVA